MAKDNENTPDPDGDQMFAAALEALSSQGNPNAAFVYLGDPDAVEAILRSLCADAISMFGSHPKDVQAHAAGIDDKIEEYALLFLGSDPKRHRPVIGWNEPGSIDEFCVRHGFALKDEAPLQRMKTVLFGLVTTMGSLVELASDRETLPEQWDWQVGAEIGAYRDLLLGTFSNDADGNVSIGSDTLKEGLSDSETGMDDFESYP